MKTCASCHEPKPISEFVIDSRRKDGRGSYCRSCHSKRTAAHKKELRSKNPGLAKKNDAADYAKRATSQVFVLHNRERAKQYREANPGKSKLQQAAWRAMNRDALLERRRKHYEKNKHKYLSIVRDYRQKNIEKARLWQRQHQAKRRSARVSWANDEAIKAIYKLAKSMSESTGIPHEVDHIIPIRGRVVCGLHVENNLQVIKKVDNMRKGNRWRHE